MKVEREQPDAESLGGWKGWLSLCHADGSVTWRSFEMPVLRSKMLAVGQYPCLWDPERPRRLRWLLPGGKVHQP